MKRIYAVFDLMATVLNNVDRKLLDERHISEKVVLGLLTTEDYLDAYWALTTPNHWDRRPNHENEWIDHFIVELESRIKRFSASK